jgi:DNA-directed RNA polymerase subunit RPC12/RpoP
MSSCINCGKSGFNLDRKGYECTNCGYRNIETKKLDVSPLYYCSACGCHYLEATCVHGPDERVEKKV